VRRAPLECSWLPDVQWLRCQPCASTFTSPSASLELTNRSRDGAVLAHILVERLSNARRSMNGYCDESAPQRQLGGWGRRLAIAAAALAIATSAAGMSERAAAAGQQNLSSTSTHAGYVKKAELGKLVGE
jgi:hypothetical protein